MQATHSPVKKHLRADLEPLAKTTYTLTKLTEGPENPLYDPNDHRIVMLKASVEEQKEGGSCWVEHKLEPLVETQHKKKKQTAQRCTFGLPRIRSSQRRGKMKVPAAAAGNTTTSSKHSGTTTPQSQLIMMNGSTTTCSSSSPTSNAPPLPELMTPQQRVRHELFVRKRGPNYYKNDSSIGGNKSKTSQTPEPTASKTLLQSSLPPLPVRSHTSMGLSSSGTTSKPPAAAASQQQPPPLKSPLSPTGTATAYEDPNADDSEDEEEMDEIKLAKRRRQRKRGHYITGHDKMCTGCTNGCKYCKDVNKMVDEFEVILQKRMEREEHQRQLREMTMTANGGRDSTHQLTGMINSAANSGEF